MHTVSLVIPNTLLNDEPSQRKWYPPIILANKLQVIRPFRPAQIEPGQEALWHQGFPLTILYTQNNFVPGFSTTFTDLIYEPHPIPNHPQDPCT